MDVLSKSISETKKLAIDVEDRKKEIASLESDLEAEEQIVSSLKKDLDCIRQQNANLQLASEHFKSNTATLKTLREALKSSMLKFAHLKLFIQKTEPTEEQQKVKRDHNKSNYGLMLEKYEEHPLFSAIVHEEATEKELAAKILQKRNDLMKLEIELNSVMNN